MIELVEACFTYPGSDAPALGPVSLEIAQGQTVALLGPNGSGKSTLARLTNALFLPSAGVVRVDGIDTRDETRVWDIRSRVTFVQQNPENQIVGTVVEEDVAFGPENLGVERSEVRRRVDEALAAVGLSGLERREPHLLSEGQKQRLAIAGALALRPAYLVLDEPTAMLDGVGRRDVLGVLGVLRSSGVSILHVTHHLADVVDADRAVVLRDGLVAFDGAPATLMSDPLLVQALGLDMPALSRLAFELKELGVPVPDSARDVDSVVDAIWA